MSAVLLAFAMVVGAPDSVQWTRVTDGRLADDAASLMAFASTRIESATGFRSTVSRNVGSDNRGATLLDLALTISITEALAVKFLVPNVIDSDTPAANGHFGNLGLEIFVSPVVSEDHRLAVRGSVDLPTANSAGVYALAFASDIPRLAPNTTTIGAAALVEARAWRGVVGAALGADLFVYDNPNPLASNHVHVGLWVDGRWGTSFDVERVGRWTLRVTPVVEAKARATIGVDGTSTELLVGAGVALAALDKAYNATAESLTHSALGVGFYAPVLVLGPGDVDAVGRFLVTFEISFQTADAAYIAVGHSS